MEVKLQQDIVAAGARYHWHRNRPQQGHLFTGILTCNWWIDSVTITGSDGQTIQETSTTSVRHQNYIFDMERFITDEPKFIRGSLDLSSLASGNYHCTVICRLTTGEEFTVRDFDFTV